MPKSDCYVPICSYHLAIATNTQTLPVTFVTSYTLMMMVMMTVVMVMVMMVMVVMVM